MEWRNIGMLETGVTDAHIIEPTFHYSNIPFEKRGLRKYHKLGQRR